MIHIRKFIAILKYSFLIDASYMVVWLNRIVSPFFFIGPYILLADNYSVNVGEYVFVGMIIWFWFSQFMFGVSGGIIQEIQDGFFQEVWHVTSTIFYLCTKSVYVMFESIYISIFFYIIAMVFDVAKISLSKILLMSLYSSVYLFGFSVLFSGIFLLIKKANNFNYIIQTLVGILSGNSIRVSKFPVIIQSVSYLLPVTYLIKVNNGLNINFLFFNFLSILYLLIGIALLKYSESKMRRTGGIDKW